MSAQTLRSTIDGDRRSGDAKIGQRLISIVLGAIACLIAAGVLSQWGRQQAIKSTVNRFMEAMIAAEADVVQSLLATSVTKADRKRLTPTPDVQATIISIVGRADDTRVRLRIEFPKFKMYSNLTIRQDREGHWRVDPQILNWWLEQLALTEATRSVMKRVLTRLDQSTVDLGTSDGRSDQLGYAVTDMRIDDSHLIGWVQIDMQNHGKTIQLPLVFQNHNQQWYLIKIENIDQAPTVLRRALAETRASFDGERLVDELQEALRVRKIEGTEVERIKPPTIPSDDSSAKPKALVPSTP